MDEVIRRLGREAARTGEAGVATRFEAALRRAGARDRLRGLYARKYLWSQRFEDLAPSADPLWRPLSAGRGVDHVHAPTAAVARLIGGACVAIPRRHLRRVLGALIDHPATHSAPESGVARLLVTDLPWVDLDAAFPSREAERALPLWRARHFLALPLAVADDELFVALADPSAEGIRQDLAEETGLQIRQVLAPRQAIERALDVLPAASAPFDCLSR